MAYSDNVFDEVEDDPYFDFDYEDFEDETDFEDEEEPPTYLVD